MISSSELKKRGKHAGADMIGIAGAEQFAAMYPKENPDRYLSGAKAIVVALVADPPAIYRAKDSRVYSGLAFPGYQKADGVVEALRNFVESRGYATRYVVRNNFYESDRRGGIAKVLQLKHAAHAAGMGVQGKHTLLVTEKYSASVRLSGFITDAPLEPDAPNAPDLCDNCDACVKSCPASAISDRDNFDVAACSAYLFGGLKLKDFASLATGSGKPDIKALFSEVPSTLRGWRKSISGGNNLYYNCGNCVRVCRPRGSAD